MKSSWNIAFVSSIRDVNRKDWQRLCDSDYPFLNYAFFEALEDSGCVGEGTAWQAHHVVIQSGLDLIGVMPLFVKTDSYGEYVFDWAWADAYFRNGMNYYPKLVSAIPYTPATGPRLCLADGVDEAQAVERLLEALLAEAQSLGASSWHCLFPREALSKQFAEHQAAQRLGCQYHWLNDGYASFEDFLTTFSSRKRKNLKRERRQVAEQGLNLTIKQGPELSREEWRQFYLFYHLTYFKRSGRHGYLNENFFLSLAENMPEQLMMVIAHAGEEMVAASLFFQGGDTLYGRYWGCSREYDFLHFEACYYQGIEYAIEKGFKRFDPGAQGEHKIQRGFIPVPTWSNHWIVHPQFRAAIEDYLERERPAMEEYIEEARGLLPFKRET